MKRKYDWSQIQKFYDEGNSLRNCMQKFGFSFTAYSKARKRSEFKCGKEESQKPIRQLSKTSLKGELSCIRFDLKALQKGALVSRPLVECQYDRIVDYQNCLYKVQIKTALTFNNGSTYAIKLVNSNRHGDQMYYGENVDVIVAYFPILDKFCWFEKEEFKGKTAISIRTKPTKNNQAFGVKMLKDYEW